MTTIKIVGVHPVAKLFPPLPDDEIAVLAESIKRIGLQSPITCDPNGLLLDGINRSKACKIARVKPLIVVYDGDPVEFILSVNIGRRHLNAGQCAVIAALACPEPEKGGRGKRRNVSILEKFSPSRLSEARAIIKHSRELALEVIAGKCTFQQAVWDAKPARQSTLIVPVYRTNPPVAPTIVTSAELRAAAANRHALPTPAAPHPNDIAAAKHRSEIENERSRESLKAHFAQRRDAAQTEPDTASVRMKDPVEQWLFDWEPERLANRVIEADRLSAGYAQQVVDAIIERMGAPPAFRH